MVLAVGLTLVPLLPVGMFVGIGKLYSDDNAGYISKLTDVFGKAYKEDMETYSAAGGFGGVSFREEGLRIALRFPESFVVLDVVSGVSADRFSTTRRESIFVSVVDTRWAVDQLDRDVKSKKLRKGKKNA